MGHKSASTVVSAMHARSAVVQEYASTVVSAMDARTVEAINDIQRVHPAHYHTFEGNNDNYKVPRSSTSRLQPSTLLTRR